MENWSQKNKTGEMLKGVFFGFAYATAVMKSALEHRTFAPAAFRGAGAIDTKRFLKKSFATDTQQGEKSALSIRLGHKCTPDAATLITTGSTDTGGEGSRFASSGRRLMDSLLIWANHGLLGFQSTGLITMVITSHQIADGQLQKSKLTTEKHGKGAGERKNDARVKIKVAADLYPFRFIAAQVKPKKLGGGWQFETFD